jgi:hypothetical protein
MEVKYVPILKIKQGEVEALGTLEQKIKKNTIPLIQFIEDTYTKRSGDYVDTIIRRLSKAWGRDDNMIFFDVSHLKSTRLIEIVADELIRRGRQFIPVIHNNYQDDYLYLVKEKYLENGVCLRITKSFISEKSISTFIGNIQKNLKIKGTDIDLVIDFQNITSAEVPVFQKLFIEIYSSLKSRDLRKIIISAGSIPLNGSEIPANAVGSIPRPEWELWNGIRKKVKDHQLIYSDYGNIHPIYETETNYTDRSTSIKYTLDKEFIIFKGDQVSDLREAGEQFVNNSKRLIKHPCYSGKDFCWGDEYIFECANGKAKYSGTPLWDKITLSHHFTKIMDLLS